MTKIVINTCFGGFRLSEKAYGALGIAWDNYGRAFREEDGRDDPRLVEVVEQMGDKVNGQHAKLKVVEVPDDVEWTIEEYDGYEHVAEVHRTWS